MEKTKKIAVVGGGLSGTEIAYQLAKNNIFIDLYEPRLNNEYKDLTHETSCLAELVCSNSFRSNKLHTAPGLLKEELRRLDSIIIKTADENAIPAGSALAVSRKDFALSLTNKIKSMPNITLIPEEVLSLEKIFNNYEKIVIATGPITSEHLSTELEKIVGEKYLYFYDAIAPLVDSETIDMNICFKASRYEDEGSYINAPFTKDEYFNFVELLKKGEKVEIKKTDLGIFFRGCLPIEVMAEEGIETLRFGPMRSDGLIDPRTGKRPYAVIQLRQDDLMATIYNMVGFQTRLKYKEQERIFRTIPGFKNIEFLRLGSMHRNTFINPTKVLKTDMSLINNEKIYIVGQLSGVEGYIESTAQAIAAARSILQKMALPNYTAIGALSSYITSSSVDNFTPMKINFGLLPRLTDEDKIKYMEGKTKFDYKLAQSKKSLSFFVDHFCK